MSKMNLNTKRTNRRSFICATAGTVAGLALMTGSATADAEIDFRFKRGAIGDDGDITWDEDEDEDEDEFDPSELDLEEFKVTGGGRVIHRELPLGDQKPYRLLLEEEEEKGSLYTQRGANINFEVEEDEDNPFFPKPGRWRGVVREEVDLVGEGEELQFTGAVTRVDFFAQRGMDPVGAFVLGLGAFKDERFEDYINKEIPNPGGNEPGPD